MSLTAVNNIVWHQKNSGDKEAGIATCPHLELLDAVRDLLVHTEVPELVQAEQFCGSWQSMRFTDAHHEPKRVRTCMTLAIMLKNAIALATQATEPLPESSLIDVANCTGAEWKDAEALWTKRQIRAEGEQLLQCWQAINTSHVRRDHNQALQMANLMLEGLISQAVGKLSHHEIPTTDNQVVSWDEARRGCIILLNFPCRGGCQRKP